MWTSLSQRLSREIANTLDWPGRFRLTAGIIISYAVFFIAANLTSLPPVPGKGGGLILQSSPAVTIALVAAALLVSTLLGKFVVGDLLLGSDAQFEGGLIAALVGMFSLVFRVGSVRYAMFAANDPKIFLMLAAELMLLYSVVIAVWLLLRQISFRQEYPAESLSTKLAATATHVVVMAACVIFLSQTDATAQGLAAVGISAMLASMAAHIAFPVRASFWYWLSPVIVGVAGYVTAYFNPSGLAIGYPDGPLAGLVRATPLAYAAAGPAGAIFGFWVAYRWNTPESAQQADAANS